MEQQPIIIDDNENPQQKAMQQPLFWISTLVYIGILLVGTIEPKIGLSGLLILALVSLVKIIIKNWQLIFALIGLGIVSAAFPPLLIIYIPVLIYFFVKRIVYLKDHYPVVITGLVIYFLPTAILATLLGRHSSFIPAFFLLIPAFIFPKALQYFVDEKDYTIKKALEIMSEAPILIISIVLPFLKIGIDFADGGFGAGEVTAHSAPVEAAGHSANAAPHWMTGETVHTTPVETISHSVNTTPNWMTGETIHSTPVEATPLTTTVLNSGMKTTTVSDFYEHLSHAKTFISQDGHEHMIQSSSPHEVVIDSHQLSQFSFHKTGMNLEVQDAQGSVIGYIEQDGLDLKITDLNHMKIGTITQENNIYIIKDQFNQTTASLDKSPQQIELAQMQQQINSDIKLVDQTDISVEISKPTSVVEIIKPNEYMTLNTIITLLLANQETQQKIAPNQPRDIYPDHKAINHLSNDSNFIQIESQPNT